MPTRIELIERLRRQVYGSFPSDDADITDGLVNRWINEGVGIAAKKNYTDNLQMDGIGYVNNSFYTKFKNLSVEQDETLTYKITLPQLPIGIGNTEGIGTLQFLDSTGQVSLPCVPISQNQGTYFQNMRPIPNKILFMPEGNFIYAKSALLLDQYTASVRMISGGDSSDLTSTLNIPDDYVSIIIEYIKGQVAFQRQQPVDAANDGQSAIRTT